MLMLTSAVLVATGPVRGDEKSSSSAAGSNHVWVQHTLSDFRAGTEEDGGANLYVTAAGEIRSIYTFDYNRDGSPDVLFVCGHNVNHAPPAFVYLNGGSGLSPLYRWELRTDGAQGGLVADLNKDGRPDVVLCGSANGMATRTPLDSWIYYGTDKGFFPTTSTRLPTFMSYSVAKIDVNEDGWDDLVFTQTGKPLLVYLNGPNGFDPERKLEVPITASFICAADIDGDGKPELIAVDKKGVQIYRIHGGTIDPKPMVQLSAPGAVRCAVGDLDKDGKPDIVVAVDEPDGSSLIFWNDGKDFSSRPPTRLPTRYAKGCAIGDLNGDGFPDIAFANNSAADTRDGEINSVVYFGSATGFSAEHKMEFPTHWASGCAIGDIDGNGHPDLVFVNQTSLHSLDTESCVYPGGPNGPDPKRRIELPTQGAVDAIIADVNGDGRNDLLFLNGADGFNGERFLRIYYNDGKGNFSTDRKVELPAFDPFSAVCADFNNDGHLDWAVPNSYEYSVQGKDVDQGSFVYWGDASGTWDTKRLTKLATHGATGVVCADLNHDGWLDLVFPQYLDPQHRQFIYWGGPNGFSEDRKTVLHMKNPRGCTLGDFNKDGWLDIVIADLDDCCATIFWGGPDGYSDDRKTVLPAGAAVTVNAADLNRDGWLDLLVVNFYDGPGRNENTNSMIYWGSPKGFSPDRRTLLPTTGGDQATIADFRKSGWLDIAIGNYATGWHDRTWFSYVYWNGPDGFSPARRQDLYTHAGSGNVALDLNNDGWLDLVMANHMQLDAHHSTQSEILWGSATGFRDDNKTLLPTDGAHETTFMDCGNIYNRRYELGYVSAVHDAGQPRRILHVERQADEPLGSHLELQFRSADSSDALSAATWQSSPQQMPAARYWQYRAVFHSRDGSNYPVLRRVELHFD
jgi:hypothetical protein